MLTYIQMCSFVSEWIFGCFISARPSASFLVCAQWLNLHLIACILKGLTVVGLRKFIRISADLIVNLNIPIYELVFIGFIFVMICLIFVFTAIAVDIIARSWILIKFAFCTWRRCFCFSSAGYLVLLSWGLSKIVSFFDPYTMILILLNLELVASIKDGNLRSIISRHHLSIMLLVALMLV